MYDGGVLSEGVRGRRVEREERRGGGGVMWFSWQVKSNAAGDLCPRGRDERWQRGEWRKWNVERLMSSGRWRCRESEKQQRGRIKTSYITQSFNKFYNVYQKEQSYIYIRPLLLLISLDCFGVSRQILEVSAVEMSDMLWFDDGITALIFQFSLPHIIVEEGASIN